MAEDLVLQPPHVHQWAAVEGGKAYHGFLHDAPAVECDCGEKAGDWSNVSVWISIEADFDFTVKEIWPDGDHPDVVTAEAVRDLLESQGGKGRVLREWNLDNDLTVTVGVGQTTVEVWK